MPDDVANQGTAGSEGANGSGAADGNGSSGSGAGGGAGGDKGGAGAGGGAAANGAQGKDDGGGWGADGDAQNSSGEKEGDKSKSGASDDAPYALEIPKELAEFTSKEGTEAFAKFAKAEGISLEHANKLAKYSAEQAKVNIEANRAFLANQSKTWLDEIKADKTLGGENFKATQTNINRALQHSGENGLHKLLSDMGVNNFPPLVRFMNKFGELLAPDKGGLPGARGGGGNDKLTTEQMQARWYGTGD